LRALVVGDLDLATLEAAFVEHHRLADVADVDDISLLKDVAAIACGHHLHLAVARLAGAEVARISMVADVTCGGRGRRCCWGWDGRGVGKSG